MRAANAKAKTELGWRPQRPMFRTYHEGIQAVVPSAQLTTAG